MVSQVEKYNAFRVLHDREGAFVMPNAWDAGSARMLAHLGFEATATTSAGYAFSAGKRDSFAGLSRDEILENAAAIVGALSESLVRPLTTAVQDNTEIAQQDLIEAIQSFCLRAVGAR